MTTPFPSGMPIQQAGPMPMEPNAGQMYTEFGNVAGQAGDDLMAYDKETRAQQEQKLRMERMIEERRAAIMAQRAKAELDLANANLLQAKAEEDARHNLATEKAAEARNKELEQYRKERYTEAEKARDRAHQKEMATLKFRQDKLAQDAATNKTKTQKTETEQSKEDFKKQYPDLDDRSLALMKKVKDSKYDLGKVQEANRKEMENLQTQIDNFNKTERRGKPATGKILSKKTFESKLQALESRKALATYLDDMVKTNPPAVKGGVPMGEVGATEESMRVRTAKKWLDSPEGVFADPVLQEQVKAIIEKWEEANGPLEELPDMSTEVPPDMETPNTWGPGGLYPPDTYGPEL